jgi:uncharacterized membrane protein
MFGCNEYTVNIFYGREELVDMKKSTFGLNQNMASLCCYAGFWVTGLIFLIQERKDKTVRFHALQSFIWFAFMMVVGIAAQIASSIIGIVPLIGGPIGSIITSVIGFITLVTWIYLMLKTHQGAKVKIPLIGNVVEAQINREG